MYRSFVKKIFDVLVALLLLPLILPALAVLGCALRLSIGSPVLFRQLRPGVFGKPFKIYKFRTMNDARDANGELLPDEFRITRIGKYIRSWSLDELPEIFNILKGEMSFVGPRPLMMRYLTRYSSEQARRHEVLPGVTGWAQINGRNDLSWEEKFVLDVWYVDHQSFALDLYIFLLTFWKVARRQGISAKGHVSASEFLGTRTDSPSSKT